MLIMRKKRKPKARFSGSCSQSSSELFVNTSSHFRVAAVSNHRLNKRLPLCVHLLIHCIGEKFITLCHFPFSNASVMLFDSTTLGFSGDARWIREKVKEAERLARVTAECSKGRSTPRFRRRHPSRQTPSGNRHDAERGSGPERSAKSRSLPTKGNSGIASGARCRDARNPMLGSRNPNRQMFSLLLSYEFRSVSRSIDVTSRSGEAVFGSVAPAQEQTE